MSWTAYQEHQGGSVNENIFADYKIRLPSGPGGCRYYVLHPEAVGIDATLPDARKLQTGSDVYLIANAGLETMDIRDAANGLLMTLPIGDCVELDLLSNATEAGTWLLRTYTSEFGLPLANNRVPIELHITEPIRTGLDIREYARSLGYTSDSIPYAVRFRLAAGITIGSSTVLTPAVTTGDWPTGTSMMIHLESGARITGMGGAGGRGANTTSVIFAAAGGTGGAALTLTLDTVLVNHGYIQGGGGGGGGGGRGNNIFGAPAPGGGGGGGAGWIESSGGTAGLLANGQSPATGNGDRGTIQLPGAGGNGTIISGFGGRGGYPGQAGATGNNGGAAGPAGAGAVGGAAGAAIRKLTGITLTKIVTGTIDGAEVFY